MSCQESCLLYIIAVLLACVVAWNIALIAVAVDESDEPCQEGLRGGIDLSTWAIVWGAENIAIVLVFVLAYGFKRQAELVIAAVAHYLFAFTWVIWGIVVLATNENNNCVASSNPLAIMCIIACALSLWTICLKRKDND